MKKMFSFRLMLSFLPGFLAGAVLLASAPLYAQGDYDLQMQSIDSLFSQMQSGCTNQVRPHFAIVGTDDHFVPSGGIKVHLQYRTSTQATWTNIGDLTVTRSPGDGDFATGSLWPDEYPSVGSINFTADNSVSFYLPGGTTQVAVQATVDYVPNQTDPHGNAIVDMNPGDNTLEISFDALAPATCTIPPVVFDICKLHPEICHPIQCRGPGCIIFHIDPDNCTRCGGPIEIITSLPPDYVLVAYTKGGVEVARSTPLAKRGAGANKQQLAFDYQKGESYAFKVVSVKGKFDQTLIKPDVQIRTIEPMRNMENIRKLPAGAIIK